MTPSQRSPSARARANISRRPSSDSATERPTFVWLWVSEADRKPLTSWKRSRMGERALEPALVRDQHADRDLVGQADAPEHLLGVGELRDHVRPHEARHLDPPHPGRARAARSAGPCRRSRSPRARSGTRRADRPRGSEHAAGSWLTIAYL